MGVSQVTGTSLFASLWRHVHVSVALQWEEIRSSSYSWYFFPGYIFQALSLFSWMSWIAPNNGPLNNVVGFVNGVGLNPWPTFDWNNMTAWLVPLTIPSFSINSQLVGIVIGTFM